jgi:uncharacterized protein YbjT (DUF2867 family)
MNQKPDTPIVSSPSSVVMMGATGAVGQEVLSALLSMPQPIQITTLGRRPAAVPAHDRLLQHVVDVHQPQTYQHYLQGQQAAICTLGVGQPSKVSQAEFIRVDKDAVLAFAVACKQGGVKHFELLGSVGADHKSRSLYLRTKGELRNALVALRFERLSIFQPSMILTPSNRYGLAQGLTLAIWPTLGHLLIGSLRKYRGVTVSTLGLAMARNLFAGGQGVEILHWPDFMALAMPRE